MYIGRQNMSQANTKNNLLIGPSHTILSFVLENNDGPSNNLNFAFIEKIIS